MWSSTPTTITITGGWVTACSTYPAHYTESLLEAGTPFTPPPASLPPLTNQPAPSDPPPQRRRRHRVQARAPPEGSTP